MTNLDRATVQGLLDAAEAGDYGPVFESFAENIVVENGPGAGPWRHAEGRDEFANVLLEFAAVFNGTFHQRGRCIHADDRVVVNLIEERGSTPAGDTFENLTVWTAGSRETASLCRPTSIRGKRLRFARCSCRCTRQSETSPPTQPPSPS